MEKVKMVAVWLHLPTNWVLVLALGVGCMLVGWLLGKAGTKGGSGKMLLLVVVVAVAVVFCTSLGSHLSTLIGR
ncbi:MAG TPA: hypothetical protein VHZ51_29405 [Ktedonobacteraceae bacterium]|nr:hypothetical protein [Ktedonobacteraceae bacterium]